MKLSCNYYKKARKKEEVCSSTRERERHPKKADERGGSKKEKEGKKKVRRRKTLLLRWGGKYRGGRISQRDVAWCALPSKILVALAKKRCKNGSVTITIASAITVIATVPDVPAVVAVHNCPHPSSG